MHCAASWPVTSRSAARSAQPDGAEECLRGLRGLAQIITDIDVQHMFVDGQDMLTWYDLHSRMAPPTPTDQPQVFARKASLW